MPRCPICNHYFDKRFYYKIHLCTKDLMDLGMVETLPFKLNLKAFEQVETDEKEEKKDEKEIPEYEKKVS